MIEKKSLEMVGLSPNCHLYDFFLAKPCGLQDPGLLQWKQSPNHWTAGEDPDVIKLKILRDISGGPVVKNPPSHVEDAG